MGRPIQDKYFAGGTRKVTGGGTADTAWIVVIFNNAGSTEVGILIEQTSTNEWTLSLDDTPLYGYTLVDTYDDSNDAGDYTDGLRPGEAVAFMYHDADGEYKLIHKLRNRIAYGRSDTEPVGTIHKYRILPEPDDTDTSFNFEWKVADI